MEKYTLSGSTYIVLVNGEYAGWLNISGGHTEILRAAMSSNPTIIDMKDIELDLSDLPDPASDYYWNGKSFEKRDIVDK
jgi:hypothetical protein